MTAPGARLTGLVPLHVGQPQSAPPESTPPPGVPRKAPLGRIGRRQSRSCPLVDPGIDWHRHGIEPRWVGMETSDCAAALEPSIFHSSGGKELQRFLAGAHTRNETALVVATIGNADDDSPRWPLATADASISLPEFRGSICGTRLPAGAHLLLAAGLSPTDQDLGLRLLNRPANAPWWTLKLSGIVLQPGDGSSAPTHREPGGNLQPILVDGLGDPVVATWVPEEGNERWYVIPDASDWNNTLDWLIHRALPAYVPNALRRARSPYFIDPEFQTKDEATARQALVELETRYAQEKTQLEDQLRLVSAAADPVRYGLLYGTGAELVAAVALVLRDAGFVVVNLDELLGDTTSADLLVTYEQERRLVEIKSAGGRAPEALVGDLKRHLETWPQLRPGEPVGGGVLIVNYQHKLEPHERVCQIYSRPEFVGALTIPALGTRELFDWWRIADWSSIRKVMLGQMNKTTGDTFPQPAVRSLSMPLPAMSQRRPRLFRRRKSAD